MILLVFVAVIALAVRALIRWLEREGALHPAQPWRLRNFPAAPSNALPSHIPKPGQIYYAFVPFEEIEGYKDRPCLVLAANEQNVVVAKISTRNYVPANPIYLPPGTVDDSQRRPSFLEPSNIRIVDVGAFRRHAGAIDADTWTMVMNRVW
ncbi:type II toxin-antitoxin system PemK/MazF family toxin [Streptomyces sp. SBT349]|uniref:type II toxin-antitoxin system PemK/MazF family toxin n=1 Tax=Streptomyces sp. SBT349 TaxID=1580539 RepID=UPI000B1F0483|nr:type II toxin-antitoxin system PemK/MazF family toxin [Streptomyces sp. SBT349]